MTILDVYHCPTQHDEHHRKQLSFASGVPR